MKAGISAAVLFMPEPPFGLIKIVFVIRRIDDYLFAFGTAITFHMVWREYRNFKMQCKFFLSVRKSAYKVFSFAPDCVSAVEISMDHFGFAERTFHKNSLLFIVFEGYRLR